MKNTLKLNSTLYAHHKDFVALFAMRTLAKSLCVSWPSVNARGGQILCVPTKGTDNTNSENKDPNEKPEENNKNIQSQTAVKPIEENITTSVVQ